VGGLVTGLDTNALVDQLAQLERRPILILQAKAKELNTFQTAWQAIGNRLSTMDSILAKIADPKAYSALQVLSSSETLTASVNGNVNPGTWEIKIDRLAQARVVASEAITTVGPGVFELNGVTVNLTEATDVGGLALLINGAGKASYEFQAIGEGEMQVFGNYLGEADANLRIEVQDRDVLVYRDDVLVETFSEALSISGEGSVVMDGLTISLSQAQTGDILEIDANSSKEMGVTASVVDGRLVLKADSSNPIIYSDNQGILEQIGILDEEGKEKHVLIQGSTALFSVNGMVLERDSNTIDDVLTGISFELKEADGKPIELSVSRDHKDLKQNLEEFVNQYNALMNALGSQGPLGRDTLSYRLETALRRSVTAIGIGGGINSFRDIGIASTDRSGKLELSMEKLEALLSTNPSALRDLLAGEDGLINETRSVLKQWSDTQGVIKTRLDTYKAQIRTNESGIRRAEERAQRKEEQLWRQFTAMEKALSSLNNQGNWLVGQLSSLPGYSNY